MPLHVDGASGGFVWPFLYPDSEWDFRLEQVRSINVSGHKFGLVYPGIGWLIFREKSDLAEDLVFYENYLGKTDATFTLNFSTGAAMVLAQYYNFVRLGHEGYTLRDGARCSRTRSALAERPRRDIGRFELIGDDARAAAAGRLPTSPSERRYDEFDIAWQLSAERGWMLPAYTMPPNAENVKMHARAGQGDAQPRAGRHARRRHRRGLRRRSRRRAAPASASASKVKTGVGY